VVAVPRTYKTYLTPRWIGLHLLVWAAAVAMVFLGRWQLQVSNEKHFDLQNFGYAFQWWAFSGFAIFLWAKALRDGVRGVAPGESTSGQLVLRSDQIARVRRLQRLLVAAGIG
jgi:DNA-binding transcriptional regulator of glucitol operon